MPHFETKANFGFWDPSQNTRRTPTVPPCIRERIRRNAKLDTPTNFFFNFWRGELCNCSYATDKDTTVDMESETAFRFSQTGSG